MNCYRAYEIDLEDLLIDPESEELREFAAHSESCADCAGELALHRGMLARLKDEDADEVVHPADEALLQLARRPESLSQELRTSLRAHLRDCHPCDDAYRATLMLIPEPQLSPVARAVEALRGWLAPSAMRAWAPVAIALVMAAGVTWQLDPLGFRDTPPELQVRGVPGEFALEVEVGAGERGSFSLYGIDDHDVVLLRVAVPAELFGHDIPARIATESGSSVIFEGSLEWDPERRDSGFIEPVAGIFDRDSYRVEVVPADGAPQTFWLDVR
jgi:hypothetical protein